MPEQEEGATNTGGPLGNAAGETVELNEGQLAQVSYDSNEGYTINTLDGRTLTGNGPMTVTGSAGNRTYTFPGGLQSADEAAGIRPMGGAAQFTYTPPVAQQFDVATFMEACTCSLCRPTAQTLHRRAADEAAARQRREEAQVRQREMMARRAEAERRASETLRAILRPDELAQWTRTGRLIITGSDGKRYRINEGMVYNVALLDDSDEVLAHLCCHPDMYPIYSASDPEPLPILDVHVAQVLWLRHDLRRFWETANIDWRNQHAREKYERRLQRRRIARLRLKRIRELAS